MRTDKRRLQERIRQRKHREKERSEITRIKTTSGCIDCGYRHPAALHFHHKIPSEKLSRISIMISTNQSQKSIMEEIKKCVVLCANCHAVRHWEENAKTYKQESEKTT